MSLLQAVTYSDAACTTPGLYIAQMATADLCTTMETASGGGKCMVVDQASIKVTCESVSDLNAYVKSLATQSSTVGMGYSDATCSTPTGFYLLPGKDLSTNLDKDGKVPFTFPSGETAHFVPKMCTGLTASQSQILQGLPAIAAVKVYSSTDIPNGSTRSKAISIVALLPMVLIGIFAFF